MRKAGEKSKQTILENNLYTLPSALTIIAIGITCALYIRREDDYGWLSRLIDSIRNLQPQFSNIFKSDDFAKSIYYQGSLLYGLVVALFVGACLFAIVLGTYVIKDSLEHRSLINRSVLLLGLSALVVGIAFHFFQMPLNNRISDYHDVWSQLIIRAITDERVGYLHLWLDALGIAIAVYLALTASTILYSISKKIGGATHLKRQMKHLRFILYAGAVLLVLGVLRLSILFHWSLNFLQIPSDDKEASYLYNNLTSLVSSLVTFMGAFYTLLLSVIYIPSALMLNKQAATSGDESLPLSGQLIRLAAILGPLLAGPLGELLGRLK